GVAVGEADVGSVGVVVTGVVAGGTVVIGSGGNAGTGVGARGVVMMGGVWARAGIISANGAQSSARVGRARPRRRGKREVKRQVLRYLLFDVTQRRNQPRKQTVSIV